jgi:F-type H+-transporting ATPase subunit b
MKLAYLVLAFVVLVTSRAFAAPTPPAPEPPAPAGAQPGSPPGTPLDRGPAAHGLRRPPHALPGAQRPEMTGGSVVAVPPKEEAEEHGPKEINWVDFDNKEQPPYLAALINFAILITIYVTFGRKPIEAALIARRDEVKKQIDEAQKIKHEAEARQKQYASKLNDLGAELESTKAALAAAGAGEKARIVKEAEEKAARMEKDAHFLLEQEKKQMELDLRREAVEAAVTHAERLLREKVTAADQERMAEEFLATLVPDAKRATTGGAS